MLFKLKCPRCGFAFVIDTPDDLTEDEIREVKACPCGEQMEDDETLPPWNEIRPKGRSVVTDINVGHKGEREL